MNLGVASIALVLALTAPQLGPSSRPDAPATGSGGAAPGVACDATQLTLADSNERLQMGAYILAGDEVHGGPASCVASVSSDSPNAKASLSAKHDVATVLILAQHEGFANVSVFASDGALIGVIRVSVYKREYPNKKH
ncbi:MAG: hypothetical protein ABI186_01795 [Candidatus Elarobacter sp.]